MNKLSLVPITLDEANEYVRLHHRHNNPVPGAKFSLAVTAYDVICGVAIVGRPVARHMDDGWTLEVNRTCTDGTKNANSFLYAAAWRATRALGYRKLITYTLQSESGATMRALGWRCVAEIAAREWGCVSRPRITRHTIQDRFRWEAK